MAEESDSKLLYRMLFGAVPSGTPPTGNRVDLRNQAGDASGFRLSFSASAGLVGRAQWYSPIFSFRPDLGDSGVGRNETALPIWRTSVLGGSTTVWVQIYGISALTREIEVTSTEYASIMTPSITTGRLPSISQPQDITADFYDGGDTVIFPFVPPVGNGPIKFWQVGLTFDQITGSLGDVNLRVTWGAY